MAGGARLQLKLPQSFKSMQLPSQGAFFWPLESKLFAPESYNSILALHHTTGDHQCHHERR